FFSILPHNLTSSSFSAICRKTFPLSSNKILGIGGDVGGSIRMPCHFTGIAGIKPSHLRFSHRGVCGSVPGRPLINSNDGPMTMDIETTVDFLREVWRDDWMSIQDPYVPPVLWNEEQYKEGTTYRIGYYVDDGWFTPIPAIQRAVLEAKSHLEAAGHTLVPFHPPSIPRIMRHFVRAVCVDGGQFLTKKLFNDIIDPTLYAQVALFMIPLWLQRILSYPMKFIFPRLANMMQSMALNTGGKWSDHLSTGYRRRLCSSNYETDPLLDPTEVF
ncbi:Fatty-acid amide hydrolase 1, partial [Trichostrongylus colubriformis]